MTEVFGGWEIYTDLVYVPLSRFFNNLHNIYNKLNYIILYRHAGNFECLCSRFHLRE